MTLRWGYVDYRRPKVPFEYYRGCCMAWLEQRGDTFRIAFRFRGEKFRVNLKATEPKEANGCLSRLEENLRLVERGRLDEPPGAELLQYFHLIRPPYFPILSIEEFQGKTAGADPAVRELFWSSLR